MRGTEDIGVRGARPTWRVAGRTAAALAVALLGAACAGAGAGPAGPAGPNPVRVPVAPEEPAPIPAGVAPPPGVYAPGFDALHYDIRILLPDTGSAIRGRTTALIALVAPRRDTLPLDLTGLAVDSVTVDGAPSGYRYAAGKLRIAVPEAARPGDTLRVAVTYEGHPDDGLIIGPDVHGERTAFADDWPDRARFWFPCIDHPDDKATVRIRVAAPRPWRVVANGRAEPAGGWPAAGWPAAWPVDPARYTVADWVESVPIPTYTMVLGAARFVVGAAPGEPPPPGPVSDGPVRVRWWLFPEDTAAARSFRHANDIVAFYSALVAPFPYEKLAHVESATRYGGMENASAIFYDEKALAAGVDIEETVAHETAHQWFGDSVTESDWHDLWLSEGFATYFSALYLEHAYGQSRFRRVMARSRAAVLAAPEVARPVIDPEQRDLFALLNRNNYDKGAWVLHMLRGLVGDSAFHAGIRRYYQAHAGGNARTADLQRALEAASGRPLDWFFQQWLYRPGYPRLQLSWQSLGGDSVAVTVRQAQPAAWPVFRFPLTLELATARGPVRRQIEVRERQQTFRLAVGGAPTALTPDPDGWLLASFAEAPAGAAPDAGR